MLTTICLHGPESTGKTAMAHRLAEHFDAPLVEDFGRSYRERFGTGLTMADLIQIAHAQDARTKAAIARGDFPVILDTDPLTSAICAELTFGRRDAWFDHWTGAADLYLLFDADLPWAEDPARRFGGADARQRFLDLSRAEFERRDLAYAVIGGEGSRRYLAALAAIRGVAGAPLVRAG